MPFLNLSYSLLSYEDQESSTNPKIKIPDITVNVDGVIINNNRTDSGTVSPNQIRNISTSSRTMLWDATTELTFLRHLASTGSTSVRMYWTKTGTAPAFRTNRNIGGAADTIVSITRVNDYVARIQNVNGTVWTLGSVQVNDYIKFDEENDLYTNPFSAQNKDKEFLVLAVGADFIDFADNGAAAEDPIVTLGADFADILKVLSQGPALVGDIIQINNSSINPSNTGKFEVTDVSDNYIELTNPLMVADTFLYTAGSVVVYEFLVGFVHLRATGPFQIRFDDQQEWVSVTRLGTHAIFLGSVSTHNIQIKNDGPATITFSIQTAKVS